MTFPQALSPQPLSPQPLSPQPFPPQATPQQPTPQQPTPQQAASQQPASQQPTAQHRLRRSIAGATVAALLGAGAGVGSYAWAAPDLWKPAASPVQVTTATAADSPVLDGTVTAAAAAIEPSVVTITTQTRSGVGVGTGVVLDDAGHILTNNHVVEGAGPDGAVTVLFQDGTTAKATVVGTSPTNDLAVVKVDVAKLGAATTLAPATFATSASVQVGQTVVAAGAPLGLSETITSGIVSNIARPVRSGANNDAVYLAVQTDAAINPGNSGGPLVNLNGDVVGINSSIATTGSTDGGSGNIGIGFAIPADVASRVAADIIATGTSTNAAMGVTVSGAGDAPLSVSGVQLQSVARGGAADEAGLRAGDRVTAVNDFSTTTADGLIAATRFYAPGTMVTVRYVRDGRAGTADVTLGTA